jgi:ribonuclease Z
MDHACIRLGDLWKMAMYFPAIEQNFRDIKDEGDEEEEALVMKASLTRD